MKKDDIAFTKARYDFCLQLFEREKENRETLERKAQLNFSFITIFLGAIFLNIGFFDSLKNILEKNDLPGFTWVVYAPLVIFAVSLFFALVSLITAVQIQVYRAENPANISELLFGQDSLYLKEKTEMALLDKLALNYSVAAEHNREVNRFKAKRIQLATYLISTAVISLFLFLWIFIFLIFS